MTQTRVEPRATETLPYRWYVDPAVAAAERDQIFRRSWQYAGHTGELDGPGSLFPTQAGGLPLVVTLDREGELGAFLNVCRHRGTILVDEPQRRGTIQCPYHAWTYGLDGALRAAPRSSDEPGFEPEGLGLVPVAVDTWGPFVFVNPDPDAPPLAEALGDLPAVVAAGGLDVDALRFHHRVRYDIEANWKIALENYLECYHCQLNHPDLARVIDPQAQRQEVAGPRLSQFPPLRPGASGAVRAARGRSRRPVPPPLPGDEVQREPGPAQPVHRTRVAHRPRPHQRLVRLLLRRGRRRGLDRGDAGLRLPGGRRGHRAGGGGAARARAAARCRTGGCWRTPRC